MFLKVQSPALLQAAEVTELAGMSRYPASGKTNKVVSKEGQLAMQQTVQQRGSQHIEEQDQGEGNVAHQEG